MRWCVELILLMKMSAQIVLISTAVGTYRGSFYSLVPQALLPKPLGAEALCRERRAALRAERPAEVWLCHLEALWARKGHCES